MSVSPITRSMRAPTCSSAPPCSKGFQAFLASSACAASATSYPSCSAASLPWPSGFSWAAPLSKAGRSLLAFGSNSAVKRTASPPLTLAVSPLQNYLCRPAFIPAFCLSQRFSLLGLVLALSFACKCSAGFKPFWPPAPVLLALEALSLVAFRGCVALCLTPSGLTRQSSGPAKGGPLTFTVRWHENPPLSRCGTGLFRWSCAELAWRSRALHRRAQEV